MSDKKVIVITGSGKGLGKALAIGLSRQNHSVVAGIRNPKEVSLLQDRLNPGCSVQVCDITKQGDCKDLIEYAITRYGRVDVVINNAATYVPTSYVETSPEAIRQALDVAVTGSAMISKYALDHMSKQKSGHIISISGAAIKEELPAYKAKDPHTVDLITKFAKTNLHNLLRYEGAYHNVKVTSFFMYWLASNMDIDDTQSAPAGANHPREAVEKIAQIIAHPVDEYILTTP